MLLTKLDVQPSEAIFIDDNEHNVAGAHAVGILGILFTDATQLKNVLRDLKVHDDQSSRQNAAL